MADDDDSSTWEFDDPRWDAQLAQAAAVPSSSTTLTGMGFVPGESLGKKRSPSPRDHDDDDDDDHPVEERELFGAFDRPGLGGGGGGGLGSKSRTSGLGSTGGIGSGLGSKSGVGSSQGSTREPSPVAATEKARTEPISFHMRDRRTGLGIPSSSKKYTPTPLTPAEIAALPLPDVNLYLSRNRDHFDNRRSHGILRSVRKTLEELDRRNGVEESVMWKAPEDVGVLDELQGRRGNRRAFQKGDVDPDSEFGVDVEGERKDEDLRRRGGARGALGYEKGESRFVVEDDGKEDPDKVERDKLDLEEEEEWLSFEPNVRLALTLQYLRSTYHYCFWCGCQYNDAEDMAEHCPGEDEKDHE